MNIIKYKKGLIILLLIIITPFLFYSCFDKWSGSSNLSSESFDWSMSDWSFCTNNQQTRTVNCKTNNGSITEDSFCSETKKPITSQSCYVTYSWQGIWGSCENNKQTRALVCKDSNGLTVLDSYCTTTKPTTTQSCNIVLNDTGLTKFKNNESNTLTTEPTDKYIGQDASFGRDAKYNDNGDGSAGFSFLKLGADAKVLSIQNANWDNNGSEVNGTKWSCVLDNLTGLLWEVKTEDGGLQSSSNTYSWYLEDTTKNGGDKGLQNAGQCSGGINCDTTNYVLKINEQSLCTFKDWRLPTLEELLTIIDYSKAGSITVDKNYFPTILPSLYLTTTPYVSNSLNAWGLNFYNGLNYDLNKRNPYYLMLVRGKQ